MVITIAVVCAFIGLAIISIANMNAFGVIGAPIRGNSTGLALFFFTVAQLLGAVMLHVIVTALALFRFTEAGLVGVVMLHAIMTGLALFRFTVTELVGVVILNVIMAALALLLLFTVAGLIGIAMLQVVVATVDGHLVLVAAQAGETADQAVVIYAFVDGDFILSTRSRSRLNVSIDLPRTITTTFWR
jgi:hypothetical protein